MQAAMVPLMMTTLSVVIASQVRGLGGQIGTLVRVVPIYAAFVVIMVAIGIATSRATRLDVPAARALTFSGTTP